jgi:hypothetical protein
VLLPTAREFMTAVDRTRRRIVIDVWPGLLEDVEPPGSEGA